MKLKRLFLPDNYIERLEPKYFEDSPDSLIIYQPQVYIDTVSRMQKEKRLPMLIDVGCGAAQKLLTQVPPSIETVGIDYGANIEYLKKHHPDQIWKDVDLEYINYDVFTDKYLTDATVVCADVIEHLKFPERLLGTFVQWIQLVKEIVITTPDRVLTYGIEHQGPPPNPCHVREWSILEFQNLLESYKLHPRISYTQSVNTSPNKYTIQAVITRK